jgi:large subunit ribosomal protein L19
MKEHIRKAIEAPVNPNIPDIKPGDSVVVEVRIKEADKERMQEFKGTVIKTRGSGNNASFTVRRIASHGIGVERSFLLRSPRIAKVSITRRSKVRRSKLYYMRALTGTKARLKEKRSVE